MKVLSAIVLLALAANTYAAPPTIDFVYSETLDAACSLVRGPSIKNEWKIELKEIEPKFEQLWAMSGPKLMAETEKITGKSFEQKNITARLTLCNVPSDSFLGAVVNMRYALTSFTPKPVPLRYKISVLFHEILHKFLEDKLPAESPMLIVRADESQRVKNHLHLFALEKAVYLQLGRADELNEIITIDGELPDSSYKRAWQIINQSDDTYLKYINEIKSGEH